MLSSMSYQGGDDEFIICDDEHYAELWMGTHPSGPSWILNSDGMRGPLLKTYLAVRARESPVRCCPTRCVVHPSCTPTELLD